MKEYNGSGLTPLFYSEISSSYMLYDIFENCRQIIFELIHDYFHGHPSGYLSAGARGMDMLCPIE